ncbi:MAG: lysophospholipid acyltransferase family protein [Acidobacteriota bacterium]
MEVRRTGRLRALVQAAFFLLVVRPFMAMFIGLRVRGRQHLPPGDPFLLIANHSSHLDTLALLSLFPLRRLACIRPVAAADYFERTRTRAFVSRLLFNILPIDRQPLGRRADPLSRMGEALTAGDSLLLFPEGTRGRGDLVAPFHHGVAALLERLPDLVVHPAYLRNLGRSLPKGELLPVPFFCEVVLGPPVRPEGDRSAVAAALRDAVVALAVEPSGTAGGPAKPSAV